MQTPILEQVVAKLSDTEKEKAWVEVEQEFPGADWR